MFGLHPPRVLFNDRALNDYGRLGLSGRRRCHERPVSAFGCCTEAYAERFVHTLQFERLCLGWCDLAFVKDAIPVVWVCTRGSGCMLLEKGYMRRIVLAGIQRMEMELAVECYWSGRGSHGSQFSIKVKER